VLGFQKVVCQGCGSNNNVGGVEKESGNHINVVKAKNPSTSSYHDIYVSSFSGGVRVMWSNPYTMHISY
jgi:hypothetical protein